MDLKGMNTSKSITLKTDKILVLFYKRVKPPEPGVFHIYTLTNS